MLPAFIIDHIRQREEEEKAKPRQQQELPIPRRDEVHETELEEESDRGILIIDLMGK